MLKFAPMDLIEKAIRLFGEVRAEQLQVDIAKTTNELADLEKYPVTFEDEP